MQRASDNQTAV